MENGLDMNLANKKLNPGAYGCRSLLADCRLPVSQIIY